MSMIEQGAPVRVLQRVVLGAKLTQQAVREVLFERGHNERRIAALRFAEKKVDVFGHDYVAYDDQVMALANLFQDFEEEIAVVRRA